MLQKRCPKRLIRATQSKTWCDWFSCPNNPPGLDYSVDVCDVRTSTHKRFKNNPLLPFLRRNILVEKYVGEKDSRLVYF